ncbi:MAG: SIMPL domain-containing protein [Sphaerochaeta sp.]
MKKYLTLTIVLIALVALTGCQSLTNTITRTVEVSGTAQVVVQPDIASFSIQVSEKAETTSEAQQKANQKMSVLLATLREANIQDRDLQTTMINLRPSYDYIDNKQVLAGQVASQTVSVTVRDLNNIGSLIDSLGQVSSITLNSISFDKEDKSQAQSEARDLALANALAKAEQYASQVNMKTTTPITISEYSVASNPYNPRMMSMAAASYDMATEISAGTLTITSTVSLVMEIK